MLNDLPNQGHIVSGRDKPCTQVSRLPLLVSAPAVGPRRHGEHRGGAEGEEFR